jgi:hypothetical protein
MGKLYRTFVLEVFQREVPRYYQDYQEGTTMKKWAILAIFFLILIPLFLGSSCTATGDFQSTFLKAVPADMSANLMIIDLKTLRNDSDLSTIYSQVKEGFDTSSEFGFNINNIDFMGIVNSGGDSLVVMNGTIDQKLVENKLNDLGYTSETYNNIELWTDQYGYYTVAFTPAGFVVGSSQDLVMSSIRSSKGIDKSLYANQTMQALLNRGGKGMVTVMEQDEDLASQYDGATGVIATFNKMNKSSFSLRGIFQFTGSSTANNSFSSIQDDMNSLGWDISKVTQSGSSVIFEGTWWIQDFDFSYISPYGQFGL